MTIIYLLVEAVEQTLIQQAVVLVHLQELVGLVAVGLVQVNQVAHHIHLMFLVEMVQLILEAVAEAMVKLVIIQVILLEVVVADLF